MAGSRLSRVYGSEYSLRWFRKTARTAGLSDEITLHDLRHFYASLLIRNGATVKLVRATFSHHSAIETFDTNGHLWPDADEQTWIVNEALTGLRKGDSKFARTGRLLADLRTGEPRLPARGLFCIQIGVCGSRADCKPGSVSLAGR